MRVLKSAIIRAVRLNVEAKLYKVYGYYARDRNNLDMDVPRVYSIL